jgi:nucleotide sugar dehydrogenase
MKKEIVNYVPIFYGLSHIGQVFSVLWSKKIGKCAVYDPNKKIRKKFKYGKLTNEEPQLKKINYKKNIIVYEKINDLKNHNIIFFTIDTPITENGYPNLNLIKNNLKKIFSLNFQKKTCLIITSQVYPGFTKKFIEQTKSNKEIEVIYMVDTLKMGEAIKNFLFPGQLIFGCEEKNIFFLKKLFNKFKVKKFFLKITEAELVKVSINMYLFFSVSFTNIIDEVAKRNKINYSKIIECLRNDKRIGKEAYINPSLGFAGGHLERDYFYLKKVNENKKINNILDLLYEHNQKRRSILNKILKKNNHIKKILIVGISYKKESFSLVNNYFKAIINNKKWKVKIYDSYYKFKINNLKIENNFLKSLNENNAIIYNYSNKRDLGILKKFIIKNKNKTLINLSKEKFNTFKQKKITDFC